VPDTVVESADLFKLGYSVQQIAQKRGYKEDTIYNHLSQALEQGMLALQDVVELPEQDIKRIEEAILNLPEEQQNALKPVYELFDGQYSYGVLRCVRAALQCQTV
jgi:ATP-dependent DNA helicase RecQ